MMRGFLRQLAGSRLAQHRVLWFGSGLVCLLVGCNRATNMQRQMAAWVFARGGLVVARMQEQSIDLAHPGELPSEPFEIEIIRWDIYPGDRNPRVSDADLPELIPLTSLKELDLWASDVSDAGLAAIAKMPQLEKLQLSQTRITDAGLVHLESLTRLKQLGLVDTAVTPSAVRRLQKKLPQCRIVFQKTT